ncbi:238_t:CDS:2, partial [Funneliformis geosporum]
TNYHGLTVAEINQILAKCEVSPAEQVKIDRVYAEYFNVCLEKIAEYQGHDRLVKKEETKQGGFLGFGGVKKKNRIDQIRELVLVKVKIFEEKESLVGEEWRKLEAELAKPI